MQEASKNKYFIDGFLIKHFGIWPIGFKKENLFDEQKIFLVYLMGIIPEISDWATQMNYRKEIDDIDKLKTIKIDQNDIDVAKIQGRDIEKLKKDRLEKEKIKLKAEVNKKYGLKQEIEIPSHVKQLQEPNERKKLWEVLQGKGLIRETK